MKIASGTVMTQSQHFSAMRDERQESLRPWVGQRRPDFEGKQRQDSVAPNPPPPPVQISAAAQSAQSAEAQAIQAANTAVDNDPFLNLIKAMLEWMTGKPVKLFNVDLMPGQPANTPAPPQTTTPAPTTQATQAPQRAGYGLEYNYHAVHEEVEQTDFSAQGSIKTADGQEIAFKLDLSMSRQYREETNISVRAGDAVRKDPLIVNFDGAAAQLSKQHFRFDLNGDGKTLDVPLLGGGSGFLALDLNHNGKIDSGAELFGPASGSGFAELARYDQDHNGWIDENDAVFKQLRTWTPDATGSGTLSTLADHHVGAIYLGQTATPFELRGSGNQDLGVVKSSGIYLNESGHAGSIQEIDPPYKHITTLTKVVLNSARLPP